MARDSVLIHPYVTEKTMNFMSGTPTQKFKDGNKIEFLVRRDATKAQIKEDFEANFEVKVEKVWTRITKNGKRATIKLAEGYSAEDIGMRIGVF
ncbi:50S ribosomal protein L23 [Candidatus Methanomassiliicoccus intestinalis]|mgnify:CR=1 FL=1|uniref:50S ribosomal protein L23 n=1 Tax=Candidatus Methanomassiliicoccus intestinalis TaxID=1406512 RepID=UPI0037DCF88B